MNTNPYLYDSDDVPGLDFECTNNLYKRIDSIERKLKYTLISVIALSIIIVLIIALLLVRPLGASSQSSTIEDTPMFCSENISHSRFIEHCIHSSYHCSQIATGASSLNDMLDRYGTNIIFCKHCMTDNLIRQCQDSINNYNN